MKRRLLLLTLCFLFAICSEAQNLLRKADAVAMERWVDSIMATLDTPEKQLGQLIMPLYYMPEANEEQIKSVKTDICQYYLGGALLSKGTLQTQAKMTNAIQSCAKEHGLPPIMMAIDGEWGLAMRLSDAVKFPKNGDIGKINPAIRDSICYLYGREVARECRIMGIHINFAPVLDVNSNPKNPIIGIRSFGDSPQLVAECAIHYAQGLEDGGVLSVGKHFPGHGDTSTDSHTSLPLLKHGKARMDSIELYPFRRYSEAGLGGIMTAHIDFPSISGKKGCPSSASEKIVSGILRKELGFEGLTFTDGLAMKGAQIYPDVCIEALKAGNDILLQPHPLKEQMADLHKALHDGRLDPSLVEEKCRRILRWKYALGLNSYPETIATKNLKARINSEQALKLRDEMVRLSGDSKSIDFDPTLQTALLDANAPQTSARQKTTISPETSVRENGFDFHVIDSLANDGLLQKAYPGCQILVAKNGKILYNKAFGWLDAERKEPNSLNTYYDLASVSKATGTLSAVMLLFADNQLKLTDRLSAYIPDFKKGDKADLTIQQALFHETGMMDSYNFFAITIDSTSIDNRLYSFKKAAPYTAQQDKNVWFHAGLKFKPEWISRKEDKQHSLRIAEDLYIRPLFRDTIVHRIANLPLKGKGRYRYSCLNFVALRYIIEKKSGLPLDQFLATRLPDFFMAAGENIATSGGKLCYNPLQCGIPLSQIAPTENDMALRHQLLRGSVHDEIAAWSGGVEGNAGLFGNATNLYPLLQMFLDHGCYNGKQYIPAETCKMFTTRKSKVSRRGLGYDKPETNHQKASPCDKSASPAAYGHTGYTGTCFWIDPENGLIYIFLSNRVCPHRWPNTLGAQHYRDKIQAAIYDAAK